VHDGKLPPAQHSHDEPQAFLSFCVSAPPTHPPHVQLAEHVRVPVQLQLCWFPGEQAPDPTQVPHVQLEEHVRVPQFPQAPVTPATHSPQHGAHAPLQQVGVAPPQVVTA